MERREGSEGKLQAQVTCKPSHLGLCKEIPSAVQSLEPGPLVNQVFMYSAASTGEIHGPASWALDYE